LSLEKLLQATANYKYESPAKQDFRVSSLPYCGILDYIADPSKADSFDYGFDFYVKIGTAVHEILQSIMPRLKVKGVKIFGSWKCGHSHTKIDEDGNTVVTHCGHRKEWQFQPDDMKCPKNGCPGTLIYDELELLDVSNGVTLSGHIDMLIEVTVIKNGKSVAYYHILDFKTTGNALFDRPAAYVNKYYPSKKYLVQIETYATLLWRLKKIRVRKYSIVYVAREKPLNSKGQLNCHLFTYDFTKDTYRKNRFRLEEASISRALVLQLNGLLSLKEKLPLIDQLIEHKPCKDSDSYLESMDAKFYKGRCPLYENECCFKKKKLKAYLTSFADLPF
jgi:hypothetical protein